MTTHSAGHEAVFCTIVPPHILEALATSADPALSEPARRTLELDAELRARRLASEGASGGRPFGTPNRTIFDSQHRQDLPGTKVHSEMDQPSRDASVNRAHAGLGAAFDFYLKAYGQDSVDGAGAPLYATVHYADGYLNAFWDGAQMVFGDGDSKLILDPTLSVDAIGHELTHGVIQHFVSLEYAGQSGALNESLADVFGSLIKQFAMGQTAEQADWLIGDGLFGPKVQGQALRSLKAPGTAYNDPGIGKDPQPSTMDSFVKTSKDNGGVHINSGIPNHAFYLVATALGGNAWERAGKIWYAALTSGELSPNADFKDFARLTAASARNLFGDGDEVKTVLKAWSQVGIPTT